MGRGSKDLPHGEISRHGHQGWEGRLSCWTLVIDKGDSIRRRRVLRDMDSIMILVVIHSPGAIVVVAVVVPMVPVMMATTVTRDCIADGRWMGTLPRN